MKTILILLALLAAAPVHADQWRATIDEGFNKVELTRSDRIGLTILTIAVIADSYTTYSRTKGDSRCTEANPIARAMLGDRPSPGGLAALGAAQIGAVYWLTSRERQTLPPDQHQRVLFYAAGFRFAVAGWNASLSCR